MTTFNIAALQLSLENDVDNFDLIRTQVFNCKRRFRQVQMVVLPELATYGTAPKNAEVLPGPTEQKYCELAVELGIWLIPGSLYERSGDHIYNTALVINPGGKVIDRYRKIYPFLPYEEGVSCGERIVTFDVPEVGRFGVSICYDMWFPETTRAMAWNGAEIIIHPTLTNTIDRDVELSMARANASMNQCYMIDVNAAGNLAVGKSIMVGPGGEVIYQSDAQQETILVEVDLEYVRRVRATGWHGLGQVLKSFRDNPIRYPQYEEKGSEFLASLGKLKKNMSDG